MVSLSRNDPSDCSRGSRLGAHRSGRPRLAGNRNWGRPCCSCISTGNANGDGAFSSVSSPSRDPIRGYLPTRYGCCIGEVESQRVRVGPVQSACACWASTISATGLGRTICCRRRKWWELRLGGREPALALQALPTIGVSRSAWLSPVDFGAFLHIGNVRIFRASVDKCAAHCDGSGSQNCDGK